MYYEDDSRGTNFLTGLLLGAVLGVGVALLVAPQSGRRMRRSLGRLASSARDRAGERWEDLSDEVRSAVMAGRRRMKR
jgi:gas vesicle protein